MIQPALLIAWMFAGSIIAALRTEPGQSRFQWLPMALILGPLWLAIAAEQRSSRRPTPAVALVRRN